MTPNSPHTFFNYLDQNNLYGNSISHNLPTSEFSFLSVNYVKSFDLDATTKSGDYGYILEVDLQYPKHLHDAHSEYTLAAEKLLITQDMLSPYAASLIDKHVPSEKLSPNLYDKTKYVLHYENLRFYLKHGVQLTKISRILKFRQSAWMKTYIDFNTAKRREAKSPFLQSLYKILNSMVFGKTMECLRGESISNWLRIQSKPKS